jgi:hypothetical protein
VFSTGWSIPNCRPHVYFDLSYDVLYAGCEKCQAMSCDHCVDVTATRDAKKVQKVLFQWTKNFLPFPGFVTIFPVAKEIMMLGLENATLTRWAELSHLEVTAVPYPPNDLWRAYLFLRYMDGKNREKYVAERVVMMKLREAN